VVPPPEKNPGPPFLVQDDWVWDSARHVALLLSRRLLDQCDRCPGVELLSSSANRTMSVKVAPFRRISIKHIPPGLCGGQKIREFVHISISRLWIAYLVFSVRKDNISIGSWLCWVAVAASLIHIRTTSIGCKVTCWFLPIECVVLRKWICHTGE